MAKTERIELRASSAFVDRLEEMSRELRTSRAEVIRAGLDALEVILEKEKQGLKLRFTKE